MFAKKKIIEENRIVKIRDREVNCLFRFSKRNSIEVSITGRDAVKINAPNFMKKSSIEKYLAEKSGWICEALNKYASMKETHAPEKIQDGEKITLLGKDLYILLKRDIANNISIIGDEMVISTPFINSEEKRKKLLRNWVKELTNEVFQERLAACLERTSEIGISHAHPIKFRKMEKRWGTCTHDNQIILNGKLISLGIEFIDYVILHELCHFIEKNHSKKYYSLLRRVCPDYTYIRKELNRFDIKDII